VYLINRSIAIIIPKQPFVDWANQLPDSEPKVSLEELQEECTAVEELCEDIFELELFNWCAEEGRWPQERTKELFWKWFDVSFHSMVFDPYEDPIEKEK
jgi:hypothetical protein